MCTTITTAIRYLKVATPIIAIDTQDHPHTQDALVEAIQERNADTPIVAYNIADGFYARNAAGKEALQTVDKPKLEAANKQGPHVALAVALDFPMTTVVMMDNLHWHWDQAPIKQALQNLRDQFKNTRRCVIALVTQATLPVDLAQDVSYLEQPLPDETVLQSKIENIANAVDLEVDNTEVLARELRGSSPFRAEQLASQALTSDGFDRERLRAVAKKQIDDTPGLHVEPDNVSFDDIGGLDAVREFLTRYFAGPCRPTVVVRIEEIEKALAGIEGDTSGTSGDALATFLTAMEDKGWSGMLAYGISGTGKSLIAKATANEFDCKALRFDINECRDSLQGESQKRVRNAIRVMEALGGERVFFIASMNKINTLPPELKRRFTAGTWFFDIPEERQAIWAISAAQWGVEYDGYDASELTGSDIRDICKRAYELGCTITEASKFTVSVKRQDPDAIKNARDQADGKYLDANVGGPYSITNNRFKATSDATRDIDLD